MSEAPSNLEQPDRTVAAAGPPGLYGLLVEFDNVDALKVAAGQVRAAGYRRWDVHSPFPVHGMDEAMGVRHTRLPWIVFVCGVLGAIAGLTLQWWTNATNPHAWSFVPTFLQGFDFRISGKPLFSLPANIPVIFELTVLFASLAAVIGMLAMNGLPCWHHALFGHPRFGRVTSDRFFICIEARDPEFDEARTGALLAALGGTEVQRVLWPPRTPRPAWMPVVGLLVASFALLPPLMAYKATVTTSARPRIHPIQDMANQEKYRAQQANPAFADGRAMRPIVPGTLAREDVWAIAADPQFYDGRIGSVWATRFPRPIEIAEPLLRRGQRRFNIYCAPCHGLDGSGDGIVAQRARDKTEIATGWVPPLSLHEQTVRDRPVGHLFNTITNGIRTMPPYGDQISPADRWAIIAYVRALQRSQQARLEDVPPELRSELR